jgi:hypothetical protein
MGLPTSHHGDQKLNKSNMDEDACSRCRKPVEWKIIPNSDGTSTKECPHCGLKVKSKPISASSEGNNLKDNIKNALDKLNPFKK